MLWHRPLVRVDENAYAMLLTNFAKSRSQGLLAHVDWFPIPDNPQESSDRSHSADKAW